VGQSGVEVVGHGGHVVHARLPGVVDVAEDARVVAALVDELDLHGPGLGDGQLEVELARLAAVAGRAGSGRREHEEGTHAVGLDPATGSGLEVVDDERQLEPRVVARRERVLHEPEAIGGHGTVPR
jgi:hypothetical protein